MRPLVVLGAGGMLGQAIRRSWGDDGVRYLTRKDVDLRDVSTLENQVDTGSIIVNAAAYTKVDDAESEAELAFQVNADGARGVAEVAKRSESWVIHLSTDYVFDGSGKHPYAETHAGAPATVYGASKWAGENYVREILPEQSTILRTAWLYGHPGSSFVHSILKAGLTREYLDVVDDQIGQPTWSSDVASMLKKLIDSGPRAGIFHATSSGQASWCDFARSIFGLAGWDPNRIRSTTSEAFPRPAPRPSWSVLGHDCWKQQFGWTPPHWEDALERAWKTELHAIVGSGE